MKNKLAVLVPTRGRPHNLTRLAEALKNTCTSDYHLFARMDDDDTAKYSSVENSTYVVGPRVYFTGSVNELAALALAQGFTHIAILGDDVLPETVGWDDTMMNAVPDLGIAYGSDGLEHLHGVELPTHIVAPIAMYERLGWIALPALRHLFSDDVWRELGLATNFVYLPDVKLSHLHRWNKKAPDDRTYQEANDKTRRQVDKELFELWRKGKGLRDAKIALGVA